MKKFLKRLCTAGLLVGLLIAGGCGGGDNVYVPVTPSTVSLTDIYPPTPGTTPPNYSDASGANYTYHFQSSTTDYTYTIANFASGDKMIFPAGGSLLSVDNNDFTDGKITVICVSGGFGKISAVLTNLTPAQDSQILSVNSLNTLFGANTVTQK